MATDRSGLPVRITRLSDEASGLGRKDLSLALFVLAAAAAHDGRTGTDEWSKKAFRLLSPLVNDIQALPREEYDDDEAPDPENRN